MHQHPSGTPDIRLAELIAALSLATDLEMGQPLEYALQVCLLSVRLGEVLGLDEHELRDVYYLALLRHIEVGLGVRLFAYRGVAQRAVLK